MLKKAVFWGFAIMALVFAGCSGSGDKGLSGSKALNGSWTTLGITYTFTGNKMTMDAFGVKVTVPYKIKDNAITYEEKTSSGKVEYKMEYQIDGDTLTLISMGMPVKLTRVKEK